MAFKLPKGNRLRLLPEIDKMNTLKITESAVLLNLASHKIVAWSFIKLSVVYQYVGLLV